MMCQTHTTRPIPAQSTLSLSIIVSPPPTLGTSKGKEKDMTV